MQTELEDKLASLPERAGWRYAAINADRLFPNYIAFRTVEKWGNPAIVRQGIDLVWQAIGGNCPSERHIRRAIAAVEASTPDTEEFPSFYGTLAVCSGVTTILSLELLLDYSPTGVMEIFANALASVDAYLWAVNSIDTTAAIITPELEDWVQQSPLWIAELAFQSDLLDALIAENHVAVEQLRRGPRGVGLSLRERGLFSPQRIAQ